MTCDAELETRPTHYYNCCIMQVQQRCMRRGGYYYHCTTMQAAERHSTHSTHSTYSIHHITRKKERKTWTDCFFPRKSRREFVDKERITRTSPSARARTGRAGSHGLARVARVITVQAGTRMRARGSDTRSMRSGAVRSGADCSPSFYWL